MNAFKQFSLSLGKYSKAVSFINQHGMAWFYIFPVIFSALLFFFGISASQDLAEQVKVWIGMDKWEYAAWIAWSVNVIFWLLFVVVFALVSGSVILILMSPIIAFVSEKTADILEGKGSGQGWDYFFKNLWRGISLAIVNMVYELFFAVVFFFVGLIPVIGWIAGPIGMFVVSSYFFGFSYLDYMNERARRNGKESRVWVSKHKGLALGSGMPFGLVLMLPIIGPMIGSFVCLISAVAGTMSMYSYELRTQQQL